MRRLSRCRRRFPGTGIGDIPPLTEAIHGRHARCSTRVTGCRSTPATTASACYTCHPGSVTRCLRGAMGNAVAADGAWRCSARAVMAP